MALIQRHCQTSEIYGQASPLASPPDSHFHTIKAHTEMYYQTEHKICFSLNAFTSKEEGDAKERKGGVCMYRYLLTSQTSRTAHLFHNMSTYIILNLLKQVKL